MSERAWAEYVDALRALSRAPAAGEDRRRRIEDEQAAARGEADDRVQAVDLATERLEAQVEQVRAAVERTMTEAELAAEGPVAPVTLPEPESIVEARGTLTRLERQLAEDERGLAEARQRRAEARRLAQLRLRIALVAGGVLLLVVVFVIAAVV